MSAGQIRLNSGQMIPAAIANTLVILLELKDVCAPFILIACSRIQVAEKARHVLPELMHKHYALRVRIIVKWPIQSSQYSLENSLRRLSIIVPDQLQLIKQACNLPTNLICRIEQSTSIRLVFRTVLHSLALRLHPRQPNSNGNTDEGAYRLNPGRPLSLIVHPKHPNASNPPKANKPSEKRPPRSKTYPVIPNALKAHMVLHAISDGSLPRYDAAVYGGTTWPE